MQSIPIIVTRLSQNGKINISSLTFNPLEQTTLILQNTLEEKNTKETRRFTKHTIGKQKQIYQKLQTNSLASTKIHPKFNTLDHPHTRNIDENCQKMLGVKKRGKIEDTQNYLMQMGDNLQEIGKYKDRKVRIRRIQSSGTRRRLPKDFFSRQTSHGIKTQNSNRKTINNERNTIGSNGQIIFTGKQGPTSIEPFTQKQNIDTPKFKQKKPKMNVASHDTLKKCENLIMNKKKLNSLNTSKKQLCRGKSTGKYIINKKLEFKEINEKQNNYAITFDNLGLALQQNATFGQQQWPLKLKMESVQDNSQKQNRISASERQCKNKGASSFREFYGQKISGIKQKAGYFVVKKIFHD